MCSYPFIRRPVISGIGGIDFRVVPRSIFTSDSPQPTMMIWVRSIASSRRSLSLSRSTSFRRCVGLSDSATKFYATAHQNDNIRPCPAHLL
jgi:hypothetical protein